MSLFGDIINLMISGPPPSLARTIVDRDDGFLIISTIDSLDCGMETAVLHSKGTEIVERYPTKKAAMAGHQKWCEYFKTNLTGQNIGYTGYEEYTAHPLILIPYKAEDRKEFEE